MADEQHQPYFDDTRKALEFALNFEGGTKAPVMSRVMSQVRTAPRRVGKAARKRLLRQYEGNPELASFVERLLDAERGTRRSQTLAPPSPKGLDGAHLAGWVLAHFARLELHRQAILLARVARAYDRCACGSPCCSGWRRRQPWAQAVVETCKHLETMGDVLREGKRGLSSQPAMRLAIVEQFFLRNDLSLTDLARIGGVALNTAAKHKGWICEYLEQEEDSGWTDLARIFDQAGITGVF